MTNFETSENKDKSVKVFKIEDGMKTCRVDFLNKSCLNSNYVGNITSKASKAVELYKVSTSSYKRHTDNQRKGAVLVKTIEDENIVLNSDCDHSMFSNPRVLIKR